MSDHPKRRLLPCPFCGAQPEWIKRNNVWSVGCVECGVETWTYRVRGKAIARSIWNRRCAPCETPPRSQQAKPEAGSGPDYRGTKQSAP